MSHLTAAFKEKAVEALQEFLHGDTGELSIWTITFMDQPATELDVPLCSIIAGACIESHEIDLMFTDPFMEPEEVVLDLLVEQVAIAIGFAYTTELISKLEDDLSKSVA